MLPNLKKTLRKGRACVKGEKGEEPSARPATRYDNATPPEGHRASAMRYLFGKEKGRAGSNVKEGGSPA